MALESKGAFIWHAYNSLDEQQNGEVNKTRLKVSHQQVGQVWSHVLTLFWLFGHYDISMLLPAPALGSR